jgi:hypothetical protein
MYPMLFRLEAYGHVLLRSEVVACPHGAEPLAAR